MEDQTLKDIQYLLCMMEGYINDVTSLNPWECNNFKKISHRYGFTKNNLHSGIDDDEMEW